MLVVGNLVVYCRIDDETGLQCFFYIGYTVQTIPLTGAPGWEG
jgi:hypothetical protein